MAIWAKTIGTSWSAFGMPKLLICDNGLYVSLAARMAQDQPVAYFSSWVNAFPQSRELAPATGIPNIERVNDPIAHILDGKASHVIVPDLHLEGIERLARQCEIPTFGSGAGNALETDRWGLKEFLAENDLDVINSVQVEGIEAARKLIEKDPDKFVKVSVFRGDMETRSGEDFLTEYDALRHRLGQLADSIIFIVEDPIEDATEIGIDTFFLMGDGFSGSLLGIERKDAAYFGWKPARLPKETDPIVSALGDYLAKSDYNNFFSVEMRKNKHGVFVTDATCRVPSPPGGVMMAACQNFSDVVLKGEDPDYGDARYFCEIVLKSDWVAENWLKVTFPKQMADRYAFHNYCVRDGDIWIIPHDSKYREFGSALGWGATADEAKSMCIEAAEAVKANQLVFDASELEKAATDSESD
jgi:hypothetical protein